MWNHRPLASAGLPDPEPAGSPATVSGASAANQAFAPRFVRTAAAFAFAGLLPTLLVHAPLVHAFEFEDGEFRGSFDTTLSQGLTFRVANRDADLAAGANDNDGNLNYDRGLVSNTSKFTSDLDLAYRNFGAFARVTGFVDFVNENRARERTPLSEEAKAEVGSDVELLDAYVTGSFDAADMTLDLRLGKHVLNWGESTFIQNGVNAVNPFDVSKLRLPGSELREALVPVSMVSFVADPTDVLSIEGFYQLEWDKTEIDPVGSYFSTTDYVGPGAERAVIPLPGVTDSGVGFGPLTAAINADLAGFTLQHPVFGSVPAPQPLQPAFDPAFLNVARTSDREPDDSGQWGVAMRYLAEDLNNTEFGAYFLNYHSRLPLVTARTGTLEGVTAGLYAAQAVTAPTSATVGTLTSVVTPLVTEQVMAGVRAGLIDPAAAPTLIRDQVASQVSTQAAAIAQPLAIDRYAKTGRYFIYYPEDIQLFGLSFNTQLGASGWALQGEYSLRRDVPLQRAEEPLFEDGLRPIITALGLAGARPEDLPAYLANYTPTIVQGHVERDVSQIQMTATKVLGPTLGADGMVFLTEAALMHVHDMPDKTARPLESPAKGSPADGTSWGYRVATRLDYHNAVGAASLYPYVQLQHDVSGNSPAPSGPFVEDRTALTLGVNLDYLSRWQANLGYTRYAGDGNELRDRDFVSASVKYSF